jgi:predicted phosphoribosyltransferase
MSQKIKILNGVAKKLADTLKVNLKVIGLKQWKTGIMIELEHGYVDRRTNVTNDDLSMTAKIAAAHLNEFPDYYERLEQLEEQAKKYWKNKVKPNIFLK